MTIDYSKRLGTVRRLPRSARSAVAQLSSGPALLAGLERTHQPALRWYQFSPPALLLGSSQRPQEVDMAACAAAGLTIHRRGSGGGAVLGDSTLLLFDVALPTDHPLARNDVTESYRWLGMVWAAALRSFGLDAQLVSVAEARADTQDLDPLLKRVCFGGRSPYEVTVEGRKVVGLAQMRRRTGALIQAGVYLRWQPERTSALMAATQAERARLAKQLADRVAGFEDLSNERPTETALIAAVESALVQQTGLTPVDDEWNDDERAAQDLATDRYAAGGP